MSASSLCSSLLQSKGLGEGLKLRKGSLSPTSTRRNFQTTKTSARVVKFSKNDISVSPSILSANYAKLGHQTEKMKKRGSKCKVNALPDWPLMAVLVEHVQGQRDFIIHKSVWHLSDEAIKNVYTMYIMFTCWGCCFFGAAKDPYYDSEAYRKDGGDGTGNWVYEKQDDIEESARAALWREELIEEIEQKVEGLRELEEAKKEKLVR